MRLVPLPDGVLAAPDQVDPFYEALSRQRVEVAPIYFDGAGYLRIAAAPYNTRDDYDRLASAVRELLGGEAQPSFRYRVDPLDGTAEEGGQPVDGGAPSGTGCSGANEPGGAAAKLAACLGETARGDVIGKVRRLSGRPGQVPAVAEELGDPNARQRRPRHLPERQRVGPDRDARRAQGRDEQVGRGAEGEEGVIAEVVGVADGRFRPGDQGDEREVPGHQMIDHAADINPVARSRQLPLVWPYASHDAFHARDRSIQICQRISFVHGGNSISRQDLY